MNERETLEVLYTRTGGPNWNTQDNWMTEGCLGCRRLSNGQL